MDTNNYQIKLNFIEGLKDVVEKEVKLKTNHTILSQENNCFYLDFKDSLAEVLQLKSVGNVSLVTNHQNYNPGYLSKHKNILKNILDIVLQKSPDKFKIFKLSCAGADSDEVKNILKYIELEYKILAQQEADLKINIYKSKNSWEISIQVTARPLSLRPYKC